MSGHSWLRNSLALFFSICCISVKPRSIHPPFSALNESERSISYRIIALNRSFITTPIILDNKYSNSPTTIKLLTICTPVLCRIYSIYCSVINRAIHNYFKHKTNRRLLAFIKYLCTIWITLTMNKHIKYSYL